MSNDRDIFIFLNNVLVDILRSVACKSHFNELVPDKITFWKLEFCNIPHMYATMKLCS